MAQLIASRGLQPADCLAGLAGFTGHALACGIARRELRFRVEPHDFHRHPVFQVGRNAADRAPVCLRSL